MSLSIAEEFAVHMGIRDLRYQATSHMGGACPPDDLRKGLPVEVHFDAVADEVTLPKFRCADT